MTITDNIIGIDFDVVATPKGHERENMKLTLNGGSTIVIPKPTEKQVKDFGNHYLSMKPITLTIKP